jgi:hypothetical protein
VTGNRVAVVGRSVHMAGLAASLIADPALRVGRVNPESPTARRDIQKLAPDVVILDLADPHPDLTISLLRERPGLLLLGMDPSRDEMLVLSSHPARAESMPDLLHVINLHVGESHPRACVPDLARLRQIAAAAGARIPPRQRKFALTLAGITLCVGLALGLSLASSNTHTPLLGTALGGDSALSSLTFAAGIVLGGAGIALWLYWRKRN